MCEAFKSNFTPCRNYIYKNGLCHRHQEWYSSGRWLTLLKTYYPGAGVGTAERGMRILKNPKAITDATTLNNLPTRRNVWNRHDLWLLLAYSGRIQPFYLLPLWIARAKFVTTILSDCVSAGMHPERIRRNVDDMLLSIMDKTDVQTSLRYFLAHLPLFMEPAQCQTIPIFLPVILDALYAVDPYRIAFMEKDTFFEEVEKQQDKCMEEMDPARWRPSRLTLDEFRRMYRFHISQYLADAKGLLRLWCDTFKEGLMAAAWHPDRVKALLDAGVDFDDM
jgi:hypothetical protein